MTSATAIMVAFYSGGSHRSELANFEMDDLTPTEDGYLLALKESKTDQQANSFTVPVTGRAANALKTWLIKSGIREGKLFRGIKSGKTFTDNMIGNTIYKMIQRRIKRTGLNITKYSAHSLRAGFTTESVQNGKTFYEIV